MTAPAPVLNDGQSDDAVARGLVEGRDFKRVIDWPFNGRDLAYTNGFGWQRRSDPRYFPCCNGDCNGRTTT